jgi:NAD(P)-dependent dehydrogenase (short-subunit alcohol dehydrogenase family)
MTYFTGKVAVVTGAASGIGRALALGLAERGARLAISDRDATALQSFAAELSAAGTQVHSTVIDVSDREAMSQFARGVADHYGVVNQVFNNAGVGSSSKNIVDADYEDFDRVLSINLWGVIYGTKEFLPHIIASGAGHVVNVSSLNGIMAQPKLGAYVTSKFAVRGFTETLRAEMIAAKLPVAVTVVHPGGVRTNIASTTQDDSVTAETRQRAEIYNRKLFKTTAEDAAGIILNGVARMRGRIRIGQAVGVDRLVRLIPESYPRVVVAWSRRTFGE